MTGGFVYRGTAGSSFQGVYIFADNESRKFWGMTQDQGKLTSIREIGQSTEHVVSFGTDEAGELYVATYEGNLFQLDLTTTKYE